MQYNKYKNTMQLYLYLKKAPKSLGPREQIAIFTVLSLSELSYLQ